MQDIFYAVLALGAFYFLHACVILISHKAIFYPKSLIEKDPLKYNIKFEDVYLNLKDGIKLHGWYIPAKKEEEIATVLFLHGNAGNISNRVEEIGLWHHIGMNIFIIDYRGYGNSNGSPTEYGLYKDAEFAYKYLIEEKKIESEKIICFGRSIGGAIAIKLSTEVKLGGLIVSSTFTSISDLITIIFPKFLSPIIKFINPIKFSSIDIIDKLKCPVFITHGQEDKFIPFTMGKKLYDKASEPKMWYAIKTGGHNNSFFIGGKQYWYLIKSFILKSMELNKNNF